MIELLHITAHLGGGVGKVLSRLVEESHRTQDGFRHTIACLERPEKETFAAHVQAHGGELLVCPSWQELNRRAASADLVQLEWWHHPIVAGWLASKPLPAMRLIVWSHISGLHPPVIPPALVKAPHRFLFTSPCSFEHPSLARLSSETRSRMDAVFASGGFNDLPQPSRDHHDGPLRVGYVGTLNFAKLNPRLIDYLAAVRLPDFKLFMVGDPTSGEEIKMQAANAGIADRIVLRGYQRNVGAELANFDVFAYLLNPLHYGTTENALLEAMAMGVVPLVLNNPAERHLVRHGQTGLVVDSPEAFASALDWLAKNPAQRRTLSQNAAEEVRTRFAVARTATALNAHYQAVLRERKKRFDFRPAFGPEPADWFRACQGEEAWRFPDDMRESRKCLPGPHFLYEKTKSSVFHYYHAYPGDRRLAAWAADLATHLDASSTLTGRHNAPGSAMTTQDHPAPPIEEAPPATLAASGEEVCG